LANFEYVEVADFNEEQRQKFVQNWFSIAQTSSASWLGRLLKPLLTDEKRNAEVLLKAIENNPRLRELAGTPVLLSLICWVYSSNDGQLPQERSRLYEQGLELLLKSWDENRGISNRVDDEIYKKLSLCQKQELLAALAKEKFEKPDNFVMFTEAEITKVISRHLNIDNDRSLNVLRAIENHHGLLIARTQGIWSFSHLTFQEYFVTYWFERYPDYQRLAKNIFTPRWREVFYLSAESQQPCDLLMKEIKSAIDEYIANDHDLQRILDWAKIKSSSIRTIYNLSILRIIYLGFQWFAVLNPLFSLVKIVLGSKIHPCAYQG